MCQNDIVSTGICPTRRRLAMLRRAVAGALDPTSKRLADRLLRGWWPAPEQSVSVWPIKRPLSTMEGIDNVRK